MHVNALVRLIMILLCGAGIVLLQIFLSKRRSKWPGLALPAIALILSFIAILNVGVRATSTDSFERVIRDGNGVIIQEEVVSNTSDPTRDTPDLIFIVAGTFFLCNIPTLVLLAIYFACREKYRFIKAIAKMQAQDLE